MKTAAKRIELRPANKEDRKKIYTWLAGSDITSSMLGPPDYPDHSIPTWEEFCDEYTVSFFTNSGDGKGRNYIIMVNDEDVGTVGYDLLDKKKNRVVLDIWMRSAKYCGHGYGSDALIAICGYIRDEYGITNFLISPSARNKRAIGAYKRAGFEYVKLLNKAEQIKIFGQPEYDDNILMIKSL